MEPEMPEITPEKVPPDEKAPPEKAHLGKMYPEKTLLDR